MLVHVLDPEPMLDGRQKPLPEVQRSLAPLLSRAQATIDAIELMGVLDVQRLVLVGDPADQIVALAAQDHVDFVVIGSCGVSDEKHGQLGSVRDP